MLGAMLTDFSSINLFDSDGDLEVILRNAVCSCYTGFVVDAY
jgi:hypothetical protein